MTANIYLPGFVKTYVVSWSGVVRNTANKFHNIEVLDNGYSMPLSTIFKLDSSSQYYWWRKPDIHSTDMSLVTNKL